jgi:hypothetical protein
VFPVAYSLSSRILQSKPLNVLKDIINKLPEKSENEVVVLPIVGTVWPDIFKGKNNSDKGRRRETEYESLFKELSEADPGIKFICPSRIIKNLHHLKKYYFPGVWASGKNHRQFVANNPEAGGLYAKMINVHTLIYNQLRGDKTRKRTALEDLWKAQDSNLFCPDSESSPGLLNSHLRKTAYHFLIEAEKIIREKEKFTPSLSVFDFDLDGVGEYIFKDEKITFCVKSKGAGIFELDYLPCAWNYLNTTAPRDGMLAPIGGKRNAFVDWLAPAKTLPEDAGSGGIKGGRFCGDEEFEVVETDRVRRKAVFTLPPRSGIPWGDVEITKTWQLKKNCIALEYALKNASAESLSFVFGTSIDLSFPGDGEGFLRIFSTSPQPSTNPPGDVSKVQNSGEGEKESIAIGSCSPPVDGTHNNGVGRSFQSTVRNVKTLEFQDIKNEAIITLEGSRSFNGRIFHICSGFSGKEDYQSTCVMPMMQVSLEKGKIWKISFSIKISS